MKNLQLLIILIITLIVISLIQREGVDNSNQKKNIITLPPTKSQTQTPIPTQASAPTLVLPTLIPESFSQKNIKSFVYPNSIVLNKSEKEMALQSSDDPSSITNWYKEKVISLDMKAQSFVQTNTNGNILNKLAGARTGFKVTLKIEKNNSSSSTAIKVSIE